MSEATPAKYQEPDERLMEQYCSTHDVQLRNEILQQYLYLARIAARRFAGKGIEYDDLVQVASLALINALDRYDCAKGVKFASFAMPTLLGTIKNHFRDKLRIVRLPRRENELLQTLEKTRERLQQELGKPPQPEALAAAMEVSLETVYELMEARAATYTASLDADNDEDVALLNQLGVPDAELERFIDRETLAGLLASLNELEREIVRGRFFGEKSQREVASELGVSQMYISRMERKILQRMRQSLEA